MFGIKLTPAKGYVDKNDGNDEEGWTLLPSGRALALDTYLHAYDATGTESEIYDPSSGIWSLAGGTVVQLWASRAGCGESHPTYEIGPAILRPDGTVFATTNYPLVLITNNATRHKFFARTFKFASRMRCRSIGPNDRTRLLAEWSRRVRFL